MKRSFKKMLNKLLVATAVVALATVSASACTTIYTGGNLMEEGTPFVARTEDYGSHMNKLWMISEAGEFKEGETYLGCPGYGEFQWVWTHDSYRFTHFTNDVFPTCPECGEGTAEEPCTHYSYSEFGTNEYGLSVSATETISGNEAVLAADPLVQKKVDGKVGIEETDIPTVLLAEAKTAREGIELLCDIYTDYGAFFESGVFVCDKNETWYIENCSGHEFVAIKLHDDLVFLEPNMSVIGLVDLDDTENVIASPKLIEVAKKAGTFVGNEEENIIDYRASYSDLGYMGSGRLAQGLNYLDQNVKYTEAELKADNTKFTISNLKDNEIVPLYTNISVDRKLDKNDIFGYYKLSTIGKSSNQEIEIFQIFQDEKIPVEESTVGWVGVGDMSHNAFVPYYPMLMTDVYEGYQVSTEPVVKSYEKPENFDGFMLVQPSYYGNRYIQYPENWRDSFYFTFEALGSYVDYAKSTRGWAVSEEDDAYVLAQIDALQQEMNEKFAAMDPKDTTKVGMEMSAKLHKLGLEMIDYLMSWENPYTDVMEDDWFCYPVAYVTENNYMTGYETMAFGPRDAMTREQVAQVLYTAAGAPDVEVENIFDDVDVNAWYAKAVAWAADQGIVKGYGNGKFGVGDSITRQDLAVMLYKSAEAIEMSVNDLDFKDAADVSTYAVSALEWATANDIMVGTPDNMLLPLKSTTRAEFAQMFMQFDMQFMIAQPR